MAKNSFYAVQNGRSTGVFNNWDTCKSLVSGFPGARYKKFDTMAEAQSFAEQGKSFSKPSSSLRVPQSRQAYRESQSSQIGYGPHTMKSERSSGERNGPRDSRSLASKVKAGRTREMSPTRSSILRNNQESRKRGQKASQRFYGVKSSNPNYESKIFESWPECQRYVSRKSGISFKKLDSLEEAQNFINGTSSKDFEFIGQDQEQFLSQYSRVPEEGAVVQDCNVYCDGSALSNGTRSSRAGYGVYFEQDGGNNISEPLLEGAQTNNRAEIQAVSSALDQIWTNLTANKKNLRYQIKTDSEYVAKLLNDRYMGYSVQKLEQLPNSDLIAPLVQKFVKVKKFYEINEEVFGSSKFHIEWVRGHAGEAGNEKADELARLGASKS
ncbi:RNA-DNA hybrid ribonuclease [Lachancea thermotolerans CBS 6340]|uniref:Ribonuclease H n=1 Tax=Lachancea thermotolerans (strain ATCC 56472 / CBS 6340 / NRRL Y-8284) TaxID=559295 RepID=C5DHG7_LACTC|nr:KLTH0E04202p [Lachancea thermotolerans CBS 6340]CAR23228.1 KLTH0E04202p [Lachancea thermotolerans CBS 6340]